jgi:hypothetical protein
VLLSVRLVLLLVPFEPHDLKLRRSTVLDRPERGVGGKLSLKPKLDTSCRT